MLQIPRLGGALAMTIDGRDKMQVGFKDAMGYLVGVGFPTLLVPAGLVVGMFVALGAFAGPGLTIGFLAGMAFFAGMEGLRRYVLWTRPSGGQKAVAVLRIWIKIVLFGTPIVTVFVAVGFLSGCYGHSCNDLSRGFMIFMLVICAASTLMVPLGWLLLRRAIWLQPRPR